MVSVCIIGIWIGIFPPWIDLWMKSVRYNPTIDFLVVSDQKSPSDIPRNLRFINLTLRDIKEKAEKKIGMSIKLESPYKLCDYKCVFGEIFEEELQDYDYWGHCDFDMLFGDIRAFIEQYSIKQYDKFLNRGHLTLYRNSTEVIDRYKMTVALLDRIGRFFALILSGDLMRCMELTKFIGNMDGLALRSSFLQILHGNIGICA